MTRLGPNRIQFIAGIVLIVIIVLYSLYAFWDYIDGPELVIAFPQDGYATTSPLITVTGVAKRTQFISLNDRPVYIDEQGNFKETLLLQPGYTIIKAFVRDRFGREQTSIRYVLRTE